jgi:transcription elongation factor Elf1
VAVVIPRQRKRGPRQRERRLPAPVNVTHQCPTCGHQHRAQMTATGISGLDERALVILRAHALDELASAVRAGAGAEHIAEVLAVVDRCEARLNR